MNNNKSIMTDFYELTMAQTYFDSGKKDEEVYFDIFFRTNPFNGGYTLSGGLYEIIDYIQTLNNNKVEGAQRAPWFEWKFSKNTKDFYG